MAILINTPYSIRLGIAGAGTMGSGIALSALLTNMVVTLYDISPEVLESARSYIVNHLERKNKLVNLSNLTLTTNLADLRGAAIVIEAAPEILSMKEELFAQLDQICPPPAILATNTSTLPVTAIASATHSPQRVAGMHFFNPAPLMPLVEIVQAAQSHPDTIDSLVRLAEILGKTPVIARDTPGFIVNRVARPFYGEALRLLGEQVATYQDIDKLVRLGAGFPMGPFELMDLIGIDINLAATQSIYEQSFREPRFRPHWIQVQMVQQKKLGRKTGHGFYSYETNPLKQKEVTPRLGQHSGKVQVSQGGWAPGLIDDLAQAGYELVENHSATGNTIQATFICSNSSEEFRQALTDYDRVLPESHPIFCSTVIFTLAEVASWVSHPQRLVGFDGLFLVGRPTATLSTLPVTDPQVASSAQTFLAGLGKTVIWAADSPGMVLPRIISMLANEAAFVIGEGIADAKTIDRAMSLGTNFPYGPLEWASRVGYAQVLDILDHLHAEFHEDRYRAAPLMRRWARLSSLST